MSFHTRRRDGHSAANKRSNHPTRSPNMMQRTFASMRARTVASVALIALLIVTLLTTVPGLRAKAAPEPADRQHPPGPATGLGQTNTFLPTHHLTLQTPLHP